MRIPDDLSLDDMRMRANLADTLRSSRQTRGFSVHRVGQVLGVTGPAVHALECRLTWQAKTVMRYSRAVGFRILWQANNLPIPDDDDVMAIVLAAGDTSTPEREDAVHWSSFCNDLIRVRRHTVTVADQARRLGIHANAVHHWESNYDGSTVTAAQRYARGLGGSVGWRLSEIHTPLANRAPAQRKAAR